MKKQELLDRNKVPELDQGKVVWKNEEKRAPLPAVGGSNNQEKDMEELEKKFKTAKEFEAEAKEFISKEVLPREDLTEKEKNLLISKKLEEVVQRQLREENDQKIKDYVDKIKLTEQGWKERYYAEKFHVRGISETRDFTKNIRQSYIEGLQWVFAYYYNGCTSWTWFYPYHYAPFASDLMGCDKIKVKFSIGEPATPFEQLLAVFPK